MEYREIVAVTGLSGLFQLLATKNDGAIVRSLADKSTRFISARLHNVTPLESIEIYTTGENVRLHNVFQKMKDSEETPLPDAKTDNNAVKAYFKDIFPEFDEERVYVSDMKKMVKWFELLKDNELLNFDTVQAEETSEEETSAPDTTPDTSAKSEETEAEKPVKKARAKKSADTEAASEAIAEAEEKPKKVARKKKAAEDGNTEDAEEKPAKKVARKKKED